MDSINKHGWSKKWIRILMISTFGSVIVLTPVALIGHMKYGICGPLFALIIFIAYSVPMNRYVSKKNKEVMKRSKRA